jgi:hypothetical protein
MKHYVVRPSPNPQKYAAVVIATSTTPPDQSLDDVAADLRVQGACGTVVFDYLTANGTRTRRFFARQFDGTEFLAGRFKRVDEDEALHEASAQFFSKHLEDVDLTLLSPAMRYALAHGIVL